MIKANTAQNRSNLRINLLFWVFCFVFVVYTFRLFYIQVISHKYYKAMAQEQYWSLQEIPAKRGDILSSDGYPLATTQVSYLLYFEPKVVENKEEVAEQVALVLADLNKFDLDEPYAFHYEKNLELLSKDLYWVRVISQLSPDEKKKIEELNIKGIGFEEEPLRYYPEATLSSHVLGFVASNEKGESQGYFGIEGRLHGDLKGRPGRIIEEQDALGGPILVGGYKRIDPIDGRTVVMTIDRNIQYMVEKRLKSGVEEYNAASGTVIVMNPYNGDVLAMANFPTYDPQNFNDFEQNIESGDVHRKSIERRNLAISQTYEPGSVIKALTVAAAIDLNKVTPETTFVDEGPVQYSDYVINNWDGKHHGVQTVVELLQKSNNIGAAWVGHQVGSKHLSQYFHSFGLGQISGIDLEGEDTGILRPYETWTAIDLATASFGQGISATPLQVVNSFNVLANGGYLLQPRIISRIISEDSEVEIPVKMIRQVISAETSDTMTQLLTKAAEGGEAKYFNIQKYHVAGKTGTAQIPVNGKYDPNETNATFVGFLPTTKKFTMLVKLERPQSSIYAAETAVPLWMKIAEDLVKYYGLPAEK